VLSSPVGSTQRTRVRDEAIGSWWRCESPSPIGMIGLERRWIGEFYLGAFARDAEPSAAHFGRLDA
jgi:hypothetical protein